MTVVLLTSGASSDIEAGQFEHDPKRLPPLTFLVASLVAVGREEEARVEADKILEYYPKFSAKARATRGPYRSVKNPELKERFFNHLRQAGLPE